MRASDMMKRVSISGGVFLVLAFVLALGTGSSFAAGVPANGLFELGDGDPSFISGLGDILGSTQPGPDWEDLFDAQGLLRDDLPADALGNPFGNGIPDYVELYGGQWAVFIGDDISLGSAIDTSGFDPVSERVDRKVVSAAGDLGNSYVYTAVDADGRLLLYGGAERLDGGDGAIEFEFNQAHIRLGHGPPWEITGSRVVGDLLVRLEFAGGLLSAVSLQAWSTGSAGGEFVEMSRILGEGCNVAETLCATANAGPVDGGPWQNFDMSGDPEEIGGGRFVEFGVAVDEVVASAPEYTSIRVRTSEDIAFGYFAEGN